MIKHVRQVLKHIDDTASYPMALDDLVTKRYLRRVPIDPVTDSATTWIPIAPSEGKKDAVFDVKSGAPGKARDGTTFRDL